MSSRVDGLNYQWNSSEYDFFVANMTDKALYDLADQAYDEYYWTKYIER